MDITSDTFTSDTAIYDTITYDTIIIGAGPAGLSAAHMLGRARRSVLLIDAGQPRNRFAERMHGVLGMDGLPPARLREIGLRELAPYDVTVWEGTVEAVTAGSDTVTVSLADHLGRGRMLIVATGVADALPDIPGLAEHWGTRVLHCPYCHGWEVAGRRIGVLATETMGAYQAQLLRQWSETITAFTHAAEPLDDATRQRLLARGVRIEAAAVTQVRMTSDGALAVHTADGTLSELDAIFLGTRLRPLDAFLPSELARSDNGHGMFLDVDAAGRTSHPRIWAAGNLTSIYANVPMSMGSGSAIGGAVNAALMDEDTEAAVRARAQES